jgi:hydrogenase nickel incorporation protein HypB
MPEEGLSKIIELNEDLIENNERLAAKNKKNFSKYNIRSFDIVGAIGAGKTALLESISERISKDKKVLVINGDVATSHISQVIKNHDLSNYDVVFIENVGNLICPSDFILGTDKRIVVVSITEGPWVIRKHPLLFKYSDIAVINKIDLIDVIDVDIEDMINDAKEINPNIKIFTTSAITGENIPNLIQSLEI